MSAQLPENLSKTAVDGPAQASAPATLGDVLYAGRSKAVPSETALDILFDEAKQGLIDRELLTLFREAEIFKLTSNRNSG